MRALVSSIVTLIMLLAITVPAAAQDASTDDSEAIDPAALAALRAVTNETVADAEARIGRLEGLIESGDTAVLLPNGDVAPIDDDLVRTVLALMGQFEGRPGFDETRVASQLIEAMVVEGELGNVIRALGPTARARPVSERDVAEFASGQRAAMQRELDELRGVRDAMAEFAAGLDDLASEMTEVDAPATPADTTATAPDPEAPLDTAVDFALDLGPFPDQQCLFRTGTPFHRSLIDETTVVAFQVDTFPDGGPEFVYTGAFPNPDRYPDEPLRLFRLMDDRVADAVADGARVAFRGAWPAFCAWAVSTCPGTLPRQICLDESG